jgi:hypothetical protein
MTWHAYLHVNNPPTVWVKSSLVVIGKGSRVVSSRP